MKPMQLKRPSGHQVWEVMKSIGLNAFVDDYVIGKIDVTGRGRLRMIWDAEVGLRALKNTKGRLIFIEGNLHHLHVDVGKRRSDFRSVKGVICPGSLQLVLCLDSGRFYADIDGWNPYQDVINWLGHTFGEVIIPHARDLFGKKRDTDIAA